MLSPTGPYLSAAVLCEKVLREQDGVLSVIRIVDRITHTIADPNPPDEMPPVPLAFTALVAFKSGEARGSYTLRLRPEDPSGTQLSAMDQQVLFEGEGDRGANIVVDFNFVAEMQGLYWIDVLFQDDLVTRMPLRVIYQPQRVG